MAFKSGCFQIVTVLLAFLPLLIDVAVRACTEVCVTGEAEASHTVHEENQEMIIGRTLDFAMPMYNTVKLLPCGASLQFDSPSAVGQGYSAKARYGLMYVTAFGVEAALDGMNSEGLSFSVHTLYEEAHFPEAHNITADRADYGVGNHQLGLYLLAMHATVDEVVDQLTKGERCRIDAGRHEFCRGPGAPLAVFGQYFFATSAKMLVPEIHYSVWDKSGKGAVLEWVRDPSTQKSILRVHSNTLGVFTNTPTFDYHKHSVRYYNHLSKHPVPTISVASNETLHPPGLGSGLHGIPGDWTSSSRFIRAFKLLHAHKPRGKVETLKHAMSIIASVTQVPGASLTPQGVPELTLFRLYKDLKRNVLYYDTMSGGALRAIRFGDLVDTEGCANLDPEVSFKLYDDSGVVIQHLDVTPPSTATN